MKSASPGFTESASGIFRVAYGQAEDMLPERQEALIRALRAASQKGPTAIIFLIDKGIRSVDFSVPRFWNGVLGDKTIRLAAMAMVTRSTAVRVAAFGFGATNALRGHTLAVSAFETEDAARAWAAAALEKTPARAAQSPASPR